LQLSFGIGVYLVTHGTANVLSYSTINVTLICSGAGEYLHPLIWPCFVEYKQLEDSKLQVQPKYFSIRC